LIKLNNIKKYANTELLDKLLNEYDPCKICSVYPNNCPIARGKNGESCIRISEAKMKIDKILPLEDFIQNCELYE